MKRILRSNLFYACVITLTTFLMFFALSGFKILCSGDDYTNAFLIIKGNNRGIFISRFLSDLLIPIQSVFGNVNVYSVFMLVVGFLSVLPCIMSRSVCLMVRRKERFSPVL